MKKLFFLLLLCFSFPVLAIECPADRPVVYKGKCLSCNSFFGVQDIEETECIKCSDREYIDGDCVIKCKKNEFRGLNQLGKYNWWCNSCDHSYNTITTEEECRRCSEHIYVDGFCVLKDKPMADHDCNFLNAVQVSPKICDLCPNRENTNGYCALKKCPDGMIKTDRLDCFACDNDGDYYFVQQSVCNECPNREYIADHGQCRLKKENLIAKIKEKCKCGENEFIGYNLFYQACHCVKCSEEKNPVFGGGWYGLGTDEEECSKCANREYDGHMCFLKKCPEGKFKHKDGYCLRCGDPLDHESSKEECLLCSNREYSQNRCSLKECPKESFKNETGTCIPCSGDIFRETTGGGMTHFEAVRNYKSSKQECDKCPNRKYVGKECIFE